MAWCLACFTNRYKRAIRCAEPESDAVPVPYDWRSSVADSATVLENAVSEKLAGETRSSFHRPWVWADWWFKSLPGATKPGGRRSAASPADC